MLEVAAQVPLALFLLERGADPNALDAGFTPLHWAAGTWESGEANPVFGFTGAMSGIPDRRAKIQLVNALLDVAPPRLREALLIAFLDRLTR